MQRLISIFLCVALYWALAAGVSEGSDQEHLWADIDSLNRELAGYTRCVASHSLELALGRAIDILKSRSLGNEFERLRDDAFTRSDFKEIDAAIGRCRPAIDVFILGESNGFGVNIDFFLEKCEPGDNARDFLLLAKDGFYISDTLSGTAAFPKWIRRTESSFQGRLLKDEAKNHLEQWKTLLPRLTGLYKKLADETVHTLCTSLDQR